MKPFKLFESNELERAELTIAAKGITSKLQRMAEDLAKIEANDLMPMYDQLKAAFGNQLAEKFYSTTADQVRDLLQKVSESKGLIDNQILKLENIVNGNTNTDDLSDDVGFGNDDDAQDDAVSSDITPPDDDIFAEPSSKEPKQKTTPPEGRMRKESFTYVDKKIVESFVRLLEKKVKPVIAAKRIAEQYSIPYASVVSAIKEANETNDEKTAFNKDTYLSVRADKTSKKWCVIGNKSNFCYGKFDTKVEAQNYAIDLINAPNKLEHDVDNPLADPLQIDFYKNAKSAYKIDTYFSERLDKTSKKWCVIGNKSNYCYKKFDTKVEAQNYAIDLNVSDKLEKDANNPFSDPLQIDFFKKDDHFNLIRAYPSWCVVGDNTHYCYLKNHWKEKVEKLAKRLNALKEKEKATKKIFNQQDRNTKNMSVTEKWATNYKTPKSKRGMWDDWTIGELKSELKSLMDKKSRTDAEYTKVRQLQFAIRAKQQDRWGKISENIETGVEKHKPLIMIANRDGKNFTMKFHDYKDFQDWCNSNLSDDCTIKSVVNEAKLTKFVGAKNEKWQKENALKLDKTFVVDEDDDKWNVCGEQSKYYYGAYDSKKEALKTIEKLEADKKEEDFKMKDALRTDKTFVIEKDLDDEDEEKKIWRVTGDVSDYCYGRYGSKKEALDRVEDLRKKVK